MHRKTLGSTIFKSNVARKGEDEWLQKMNISQPTFHRLVVSARKKIADAIINGKAIKIEGGNYRI